MAKKVIALVLCLVLCLALFAGCGKTAEDAAGESTPTESTAANTGSTSSTPTASTGDATAAAVETVAAGGNAPEVLKIGTADNYGLFQFGDMTGNCVTGAYLVFDVLMSYDRETKEVYSTVLTDWYYEDDLTYVLVANENAKFSNGAAVTGEDIIYSLYTYVDRQTTWASMFDYVNFDESYAEGNKAVLKLNTPYGVGIWDTCLPLYCKEFAQNASAEDWNNPVGSGPYKVDNFTTDAGITFSLRDDYWGDNSNLPKQVELIKYGDYSTMYMDLETGNIDICYNIAESDYERGVNGESEGVAVKAVYQGDIMFFCMDVDNNEYLSDPAVREAIAYGVDWNEMRISGYGDLAVAADSVINPVSTFYTPVGTYEYNPERAKAALEGAGYKDGDITLNFVCFQNDFAKNMGETLQYYLSQMGITMNLELNEFVTVLTAYMTEGGTCFAFQGAADGSPDGDPGSYMASYMADKGGFAVCTIADPTWNEYLSNALYCSDEAVRQENYDKAAQYAFDNYLLIPIGACQNAVAWRTDVIADINANSAQFVNVLQITYAG